MERRGFLRMAGAAALGGRALAAGVEGKADRLVRAARAQLGVTAGYDPRYVRLPYPGGDVPRTTGVCADVIVRAYRDALGLDLQQRMHEDMSRDFSAYPSIWRMAHADANIDHRRVPNMECFWKRERAELWHASPGSGTAGDAFPAPVQPGDLLTWRLDGRLPHVGIVSATGVLWQTKIVHNIGRGVEEVSLEDMRGQRAWGHYRWALG